MILAGVLLLTVAVALLAVAAVLKMQIGMNFTQALLYAPLKLIWRIGDERIGLARDAEAPVIYAISHQSKLDPALMLSLLPEQTLHILDEDSAKSVWLEPWRELARTIAFNAEHVFVSRRLVRHLRGKGRLAVYLPDTVEPDTKAFRLFRAVARIAMKADAKIVPIVVGGARHLPLSLTPPRDSPAALVPRSSHQRAGRHDDQRVDGPRRQTEQHRLERAVRPAGRSARCGGRSVPARCLWPSATRPAASARRATSSRMSSRGR